MAVRKKKSKFNPFIRPTEVIKNSVSRLLIRKVGLGRKKKGKIWLNLEQCLRQLPDIEEEMPIRSCHIK